MKQLLLTLCLLFSAIGAIAQPIPATVPQSKTIYIIPIRDDIDQSMVYVIRRGVKEAMDAKADAIILHMETNGGRVDCTEDIINILNKFSHQDQLYTYIDNKAFSAGAFISAATHTIYMSPGSVIGAAAPIMMSPGGSGAQEMPGVMQEKMTSAVRGLIRTNAQRQGHNDIVFDAMVDKDQGLIISGKELIPKGKILTLTNLEAEAKYGNPPKNLLSAGTKDNLNAVITTIDSNHPQVTTIELTGFESLARLIVKLAPLLIAGAMLCGYIEFKTPGFGIFGILAIVLATIFFFGHYIAGLSGHENMVIFIIGTLLIGVELFLLPGTIAPGLIGALLIIYSLLKAMVDKYPTDPILPTIPQLQLPLQNFAIASLLLTIGIILIIRLFPKTPLYHSLVLHETNPPSQQPASAHLLQPGATGQALTILRPAGTADFGHGPIDVITQGDFIPPGTPITITKIEGNTITVTKS